MKIYETLFSVCAVVFSSIEREDLLGIISTLIVSEISKSRISMVNQIISQKFDIVNCFFDFF
ncbi:MAG TPA: hypothetical protein DDW30_07865 [Clostridiales bacterium]|nr:hypothetical protein [Clostridiales bacterium]